MKLYIRCRGQDSDRGGVRILNHFVHKESTVPGNDSQTTPINATSLNSSRADFRNLHTSDSDSGHVTDVINRHAPRATAHAPPNAATSASAAAAAAARLDRNDR